MMRRVAALLLPLTLPLTLAAAPAAQAPAAAASTDSADRALLAFLDRKFDERIALSPEGETELGLKTDNDRLDDYTEAAKVRARDLAERQLAELHARFHPARLGPAA